MGIYADGFVSFTRAPLKVCKECEDPKPSTGDFFVMREGQLSNTCHMCNTKQVRQYYDKYRAKEPGGWRKGRRGSPLTVKASKAIGGKRT